MRIMFILPKMTNGGAERVATNLCNYWCEDNDVRIVTVASDKTFYKLDGRVEFCGQELEIKRNNTFTTFGSYIKNYSKAKKFIRKNIEEFKPDCVISFLVEADYLTYLATKKNKKIVKVFSERADPIERNKIRQLMAKRAYLICDLFVCQSERICKYYDYIPKDKKVVIPNPLDVSVLPKPVLTEKNHNIVSIGRLTNQKNFSLLIDCFIGSIDKLPDDCNLLIYGDGPLRGALQKQINDSKMDHRIKLVGVSECVLDEIKDSALFVLSSNFEGFPNALLEAMALGLPVISTDFFTGAARELIKKENGFVVPVGGKRELSDSIVNIMNDEKRRSEMRKENILVRDKYDVKIIGDLWLKNISKKMEQKHEK